MYVALLHFVKNNWLFSLRAGGSRDRIIHPFTSRVALRDVYNPYGNSKAAKVIIILFNVGKFYEKISEPFWLSF